MEASKSAAASADAEPCNESVASSKTPSECAAAEFADATKSFVVDADTPPVNYPLCQRLIRRQQSNSTSNESDHTTFTNSSGYTSFTNKTTSSLDVQHSIFGVSGLSTRSQTAAIPVGNPLTITAHTTTQPSSNPRCILSPRLDYLKRAESADSATNDDTLSEKMFTGRQIFEHMDLTSRDSIPSQPSRSNSVSGSSPAAIPCKKSHILSPTALPTTSSSGTGLLLSIQGSPRPPSRALSEIGTQGTGSTGSSYQSPSACAAFSERGSRCASPIFGSMAPSPLATGRASRQFTRDCNNLVKPVALLPQHSDPGVPSGSVPLMQSPLHQPSTGSVGGQSTHNFSDHEASEPVLVAHRNLSTSSIESSSFVATSAFTSANLHINHAGSTGTPSLSGAADGELRRFSNDEDTVSETHVTVLPPRRDSMTSSSMIPTTPNKKYTTRPVTRSQQRTPSPFTMKPSALAQCVNAGGGQSTNASAYTPPINLLNNPFVLAPVSGSKRKATDVFGGAAANASPQSSANTSCSPNPQNTSSANSGCAPLAKRPMLSSPLSSPIVTVANVNSSQTNVPRPLRLYATKSCATKAWVDSSSAYIERPSNERVAPMLPSPNANSCSPPVSLNRFVVTQQHHHINLSPGAGSAALYSAAAVHGNSHMFASPSSPFSLRSKSPTPSESSVGSSDLEVMRYTSKHMGHPSIPSIPEMLGPEKLHKPVALRTKKPESSKSLNDQFFSKPAAMSPDSRVLARAKQLTVRDAHNSEKQSTAESSGATNIDCFSEPRAVEPLDSIESNKIGASHKVAESALSETSSKIEGSAESMDQGQDQPQNCSSKDSSHTEPNKSKNSDDMEIDNSQES